MAQQNQGKAMEFSIETDKKTISFIRPLDPEEILNQLTDKEFNKDEYSRIGRNIGLHQRHLFDTSVLILSSHSMKASLNWAVAWELSRQP
jgi:hypothetical protein